MLLSAMHVRLHECQGGFEQNVTVFLRDGMLPGDTL